MVLKGGAFKGSLSQGCDGVAQRVKVLTAKSGGPSSIPRTYIKLKGENRLYRIVL